MEENNTKFKILDENNIDREADVVTVIEVEGKEYVVYWECKKLCVKLPIHGNKDIWDWLYQSLFVTIIIT